MQIYSMNWLTLRVCLSTLKCVLCANKVSGMLIVSQFNASSVGFGTVLTVFVLESVITLGQSRVLLSGTIFVTVAMINF